MYVLSLVRRARYLNHVFIYSTHRAYSTCWVYEMASTTYRATSQVNSDTDSDSEEDASEDSKENAGRGLVQLDAMGIKRLEARAEYGSALNGIRLFF
jgi:hypothetical protein